MKTIGVALTLVFGLSVAACSVESSKSSGSAPKPKTNSGVKSNSGNQTHPPAADVTIATCSSDSDVGSATAVLKILNNSSKRSNYAIHVAFLDASGVNIGEGLAAQNNLDAGASARVEAVDFVTGKAAKCKLTEVERYAS